MAEVTVELEGGFTVGETVCKTVVVKDATAGDVLDAEVAAERLYMGPDGPTVQASPSQLAVELAARQVARLIDDKGVPLEMKVTVQMIRGLSRTDAETLVNAAQKLEGATLREAMLSQRGRDQEPVD